MKKFVNILTFMRIIATCFLPVIWHYLDPLPIIFFVAFVLLTDSLDGFLARKYHVVSLFGSLLDAFADKIFGIVMLFIMATIEPLFYLLVIEEIFTALITLIAALKGATTKSTFLGKIKMWVLGLSIVSCMILYFYNQGYLNINIPFIVDNIEAIVDACLFMACGSEVIVIADYLKHFIVELHNKKIRIKYKWKEKEELLHVLFDTEYYINNRNKPLYKLLLK